MLTDILVAKNLNYFIGKNSQKCKCFNCFTDCFYFMINL